MGYTSAIVSYVSLLSFVLDLLSHIDKGALQHHLAARVQIKEDVPLFAE
jgi:hypothetical protein